MSLFLYPIGKVDFNVKTLPFLSIFVSNSCGIKNDFKRWTFDKKLWSMAQKMAKISV